MAYLTGTEHKLLHFPSTRERLKRREKKMNRQTPTKKPTILIKYNDVQLLKVNLISSELY